MNSEKMIFYIKMANLVVFNKLKCMLDNLQEQITAMSQELTDAIQATSPNEGAIKELFKNKHIPLPNRYDVESCESAIRIFAKENNWRPSTIKKTLDNLKAILNNKPISSQIKQNDEKVRKLFLKFGIHISKDYSRESLLNLVQQKAKDMKWRPSTLEKNLAIILKTLDNTVEKSETIRPTINDSDSDASFIEYMASTFEAWDNAKKSQINIIEHNDIYIDNL